MNSVYSFNKKEVHQNELTIYKPIFLYAELCGLSEFLYCLIRTIRFTRV